jgi:GAF domain-containing protein
MPLPSLFPGYGREGTLKALKTFHPRPQFVLTIESAWHDLVRGPSVGRQRKFGFIGPVPFLLVLRWLILAATSLRFSKMLMRIGQESAPPPSAPALSLALTAALALAIVNIFYTLQYDERDRRWPWLFILCDIALITYFYHLVAAYSPQSDVIFLYILPLITATEYLGGWSAGGTFIIISTAFGLTLLIGQHWSIAAWAIFGTREAFLAFIVVLSLFLFEITSETLGSLLRATQRINLAYQEALELDTILDAVLRDAMELGFEFVSFSAVDPYRELIEMVKARNIPSGWMRRSKRRLHGTDIMADVVKNFKVKRFEIPAPDDSRFERETWSIFKHIQLSRVYVVVVAGGEPVGVLQAGWERERNGTISEDLANQLVELAHKHQREIARSRAHILLDEICDAVVEAILEAKAATIHLWRNDELLLQGGHGFSHAFVREISEDPKGPVRLSVSAVDCIDDPAQLEARYPPLYHRGGLRGLVVFPLAVGEDVSGVLLIHFFEQCRISDTMLSQIRVLAGHIQAAIQNRLLLAESAALTSRAWMQSRLRTVEDALASNAPLHEVLRRATEHFLYNFEADFVTLYQYDAKASTFVAPVITPGAFLREPLLDQQPGTGTLPEQLISGFSQFFTDAESETLLTVPRDASQPRFTTREKILSCAVLILQVGNPAERVGIMFVNYRRRVRFTPEDRAAMLAIASSTAVAIRTARLVQRSRETLDAIHKVERLIVEQGDPKAVLRSILVHAMSLCGASAAWFYWHDRVRNALEWRMGVNVPKREAPYYQAIDYGIVGRAAKERKPRVVRDVTSDLDYKPEIQSTRSEIAVPIVHGNDLIGVVNLESNRLSAFSAEDCPTLEMLGELAVLASRFFDLHRQRGQFGALSVVAAKLQRTQFDLDTILRVILTGITAGEGLGFSRAMIFLTDKTGTALEGRLAIGPLNGDEAKRTWETIVTNRNEGESSTAVLSRLLDYSVATSNDIRNDKCRDCDLSVRIQGARLPLVEDFRAPIVGRISDFPAACLLPLLPDDDMFLSVPLTVDGNLRGILLADRTFQRTGLDDRDVPMLQVFAEIAAMAVETRAFHAGVSDTELFARWNKSIVEHLHGIGTRLTTADGWVERLEEKVRTDSFLSQELPVALGDVRRNIRQAWRVVDNIRRYYFVQPARTAKAIDLLPILESIIRDASVSTASVVKLDISRLGSRRLPVVGDSDWFQEALMELIRNADEAMQFAQTLAPSICIRTTLGQSSNGECVIIEVEDNGRGIPEGKRDRIFEPYFSTKGEGRGMGLAIVWDRVLWLQGTIVEDGDADHGARFRIMLPLAGGIGA